jgi:hypothetical protein
MECFTCDVIVALKMFWDFDFFFQYWGLNSHLLGKHSSTTSGAGKHHFPSLPVLIGDAESRLILKKRRKQWGKCQDRIIFH